jgi:hypothetical protein
MKTRFLKDKEFDLNKTFTYSRRFREGCIIYFIVHKTGDKSETIKITYDARFLNEPRGIVYAAKRLRLARHKVRGNIVPYCLGHF